MPDPDANLLREPQAFSLHVRPGLGSFVPAAWIVTPARCSGQAPLVCVHGISREAEAMAGLLAKAAGEAGRTVVVPHFDEQSFPRYQKCLCRNRSDLALIRLVAGLQQEGWLPNGRFDLAGFSGGAQFAHRFTWFYPQRVGRLIVSSAGWYTFPDEAPFPYGMGPARAARLFQADYCLKTNLAAFLDREISIRVGEHDDVVDPATRSGPEIDAQQGADRKTRARSWHRALTSSAERLGMTARLDYAEMPGCGHDFAECVQRGGLAQTILGNNEESPRNKP